MIPSNSEVSNVQDCHRLLDPAPHSLADSIAYDTGSSVVEFAGVLPIRVDCDRVTGFGL
jgi:hypothetical protein